MSYTRFFRRDSRAGYAMEYPRVAHIVADLDELAVVGVRYRRPRRGLAFRRVVSTVRGLLEQRRLSTASARAAIVMAVAA